VRKIDIGAGVVFVVVGVWMLFQSLELNFYQEGIPGPGFFPSILSIALGATGVLLIVSRVGRPDDAFPGFEMPDRSQGVRAMGLWLATLAAVFLSGIVGFLLAMVLLVAIVVFGLEGRRGMGSIAVVVLTPLFAYWLFGVLLQIPLPAGLFGE
jgi:putative tricarboxylic transport membrane protein